MLSHVFLFVRFNPILVENNYVFSLKINNIGSDPLINVSLVFRMMCFFFGFVFLFYNTELIIVPN